MKIFFSAVTLLVGSACQVANAGRLGNHRELAKMDKCTICHLDDEGFFDTITVNCNAREAHLAHGDYDGECRELTCAEQCNHQFCMQDFFEDPVTLECTCIDPAEPTLCGLDATCNPSTDLCECPDADNYFFDADGNCVFIPICSTLTFEAPVDDADGTEDPCPDKDCVVAYPYSDIPGAVIPFGEYDETIAWGFVIDVAKACPDGLSNSDTDGGSASVKCILDMVFSTDPSDPYNNLVKSSHVKLWLFSNGISVFEATTYVDEFGSLRSSHKPRSNSDYGFEHFRMYSGECPLAPDNTVFTGRNVRSIWGDCSDTNSDLCGNIGFSTAGIGVPETAYVTFQAGLSLSMARPLQLESGSCPCWDSSSLPTSSSSNFSCSWADSSTFHDRIFLLSGSEIYDLRYYKIDESKTCRTPAMTSELSLTEDQFLACADQFVKHCNDYDLLVGPSFTAYY